MTGTSLTSKRLPRVTGALLGLMLSISCVARGQTAHAIEPASPSVAAIQDPATLRRLAQEADRLFDAGDYPGAEARLRELLPLTSATFGPQSLEMAEVQVDLGDALRAQQRHADASVAYAAGLTIWQSLPDQPPLEIEAIVYSLAGSQWAEGKLEEAAAGYFGAAHIRRTVLGERHTATAEALINFSRVEVARGRFITALSAAEEAWSIQSEVWGEQSPQAIEALSARGVARRSSGQWIQSEQDFRKVVEFLQPSATDDEASMASALADLGSGLALLGRYGEAEPLQREALAIMRRVRGPQHPDLWWPLSSYADTLHSQVVAGEQEGVLRQIAARGGVTATSVSSDERAIRARFTTVETLYREALSIARESSGPRSELTATSLTSLARVLSSQGRFAESETLTLEALEIYGERVRPLHPSVAAARFDLGDTLYALQRYEEALDQHTWARGIQQMIYTLDHTSMGEIENAIGFDLLMMDRVTLGVQRLDGAAAHRMGLVCPVGDRGAPVHHPWSYDNPDCSGLPGFTASVAANAAVRFVFENRPSASLRMVGHAGDMALGRTRARYALFNDARVEANRFGYVHRQFVSIAWAVAEADVRPEVSANLSAFHWPARAR